MRFGSSVSRESSPMLFRRSLSMRTLWPHSTRATSKLQSESVNNTSTMLSVPPDRSLAPHTLEVLKLVDRIARELELLSACGPTPWCPWQHQTADATRSDGYKEE